MPSRFVLVKTVVIVGRKLTSLRRSTLEKFAEQARVAVGLPGEVNILIAGNREVRRLNRNFRAQDMPTDVLSFPARARGMAGDIAISADIGRANAQALGHTMVEEIKILMLHGMLHLAGYDHEQDRGEMARKERSLRRKLGLPVGLIERNRLGAKDGPGQECVSAHHPSRVVRKRT